MNTSNQRESNENINRLILDSDMYRHHVEKLHSTNRNLKIRSCNRPTQETSRSLSPRGSTVITIAYWQLLPCVYHNTHKSRSYRLTRKHMHNSRNEIGTSFEFVAESKGGSPDETKSNRSGWLGMKEMRPPVTKNKNQRRRRIE